MNLTRTETKKISVIWAQLIGKKTPRLTPTRRQEIQDGMTVALESIKHFDVKKLEKAANKARSEKTIKRVTTAMSDLIFVIAAILDRRARELKVQGATPARSLPVKKQRSKQ